MFIVSLTQNFRNAVRMANNATFSQKYSIVKLLSTMRAFVMKSCKNNFNNCVPLNAYYFSIKAIILLIDRIIGMKFIIKMC